ncbi:uncharacterized protein HKW66_Vig0145310 [Vigna angularis]|uniref:Transmembrane protein n=1 Tax=Phaseolus angularis TaxID=3914 RepID=A0A8T0KFI9_PHAAN|nr:uncharacterized protein HKW66_Vig0145310 [Vigna angularis]
MASTFNIEECLLIVSQRLRNLPSEEVVNTVKEVVKKEVAPVNGFEAGKDKGIRNCKVKKDCENGEVETRKAVKMETVRHKDWEMEMARHEGCANHKLLKNAIGELLKKSITRSVSFRLSKLRIWRRRRQGNHDCEVTKGYEDREIETRKLKMKKSRGKGEDGNEVVKKVNNTRSSDEVKNKAPEVQRRDISAWSLVAVVFAIPTIIGLVGVVGLLFSGCRRVVVALSSLHSLLPLTLKFSWLHCWCYSSVVGRTHGMVSHAKASLINVMGCSPSKVVMLWWVTTRGAFFIVFLCCGGSLLVVAFHVCAIAFNLCDYLGVLE